MNDRSPEYQRLLLFMRGWKHGASSSAKLKEDGEYADGYAAGVASRIDAQRRAQALMCVSADEILSHVLRSEE